MARSTIKSRARAIAWKQLVLKRDIIKKLEAIRERLAAALPDGEGIPSGMPIHDIKTWANSAACYSIEMYAMRDAFTYAEGLTHIDSERILTKAMTEILAREESDRTKRKADHG